MKTLENKNGYEFTVFEKGEYVFEQRYCGDFKRYQLACDAVLLESQSDVDVYEADCIGLPSETINKIYCVNAGLIDLPTEDCLSKISYEDLDESLREDFDFDEADLGEFYQADFGYKYHIVFFPNIKRGGIVLVGSGSSGVTAWTDADNAVDVLKRHETDTLQR